MRSGLSDRDRDRFEALRSRLDDISTIETGSSRNPPSLGPLDPMLSKPFEGSLEKLDETKWVAERKYDGTRIILERFSDEIRTYTRRGIDRSGDIPEVIADIETSVPDGCILDAEFVFLTDEGKSQFLPIHTSKRHDRRSSLTSVLYVFDVLAHDHDWAIRRPLLERKELLSTLVEDRDHLKVVPYLSSSFATEYRRLVNRGEEGLMLKRRESHYYPGIRSNHWRKVKAFTQADVLAVGYTDGTGYRRDTFGALVMSDGQRYIGRVGSGFQADDLDMLTEMFTEVDSYPYSPTEVNRSYTPIQPFVISVKYQAVTKNGDLRAPVFLRPRFEKPTDEVTPIPAGDEKSAYSR